MPDMNPEGLSQCGKLYIYFLQERKIRSGALNTWNIFYKTDFTEGFFKALSHLCFNVQPLGMKKG